MSDPLRILRTPWETMLDHARGDVACGRPWSCACGACRVLRKEGIYTACEVGCENPDNCGDCVERTLRRPCWKGFSEADGCRHPPGECHFHQGHESGNCDLCAELTGG